MTQTMAFYDYNRVSTPDQDLSIQEQPLRMPQVRVEKATATTRAGRKELQLLLDFLRRGDIFVVTTFKSTNRTGHKPSRNDQTRMPASEGEP